MKVLVIGSGAREHAMAWKISQSPKKPEVFCLPGNPGTEAIATNVNVKLENLDAVVAWAIENKIDLTVVGPEAPLAAGIVDVFESKGLKIFGPQKKAALLESSKSFAKEVMLKAGVVTAKGAVFEDFNAAKAYVEKEGAPIVVKADGLAAGKGVVVAQNKQEAIAALESFMLENTLGSSGSKVVIEQCLVGKEASIIAIIDGEDVLPLVISQDYKRVDNGDQGPNTGGMGAISPTPVFSDSNINEVVETVFLPTIRELAKNGVRYRGFLYAGILVDQSGKANVLEFNCRLGDPETQVIMLRMENDLLDVLEKAVAGKLSEVKLIASKKSAACVVASSKGYPGKVDDGKIISGLNAGSSDLQVFHAGTKKDAQGNVISSGGRILTVAALADNIEEALNKAYQGMSQVKFEGMHFRTDIGRTN
ncbi:MAG: phosphoribosylamine--glycine ligase [Proteobacteria bacterium]|nr:phosphoribosylamine--glycine ligase [Pseudomonadota bacterium]